MTSQAWMLIPQNPALSVLVLAVLAMLFLYAARKPMHSLIRSSARSLVGPLRLGARWLVATSNAISWRNKAVLLAHGRRETEQRIEREFERVGALVQRELQGYPALQRKLLDEITRVEEDYRKCGEVPPPPPDWVEAVTAMASVKSGNELVQRVLEEVRRSVDKIHDKAIAEYRRSYEERHRILEGFMPFWRSLDKTLGRVDRNLSALQASAASVDGHMQKYEQIVAGSDKAEHELTVSAFTQFAISLFVVLVAAGGAFINFKLIALPMSEMVGAGDYITGSLRTSEVAALVIILVEGSMGLFLLESLRITHLFPRIANLGDHVRRRIFWIALTLLVTLAGVEAALALMRDMLIADKQALLQSLSSVPQPAVTDGWVGRIPTAGQMVLGFMLPFALAFVAIPLESLIHASRTVGGVLLSALVRSAAFALRLASNLAKHLSRVAVALYDVAIVIPLLVERMVLSAKKEKAPRRQRAAIEDDIEDAEKTHA
jgi:hypothetical protein